MSGLLAGFIGGLAKGGLDIINTEEAQQRKIEDEARREEATMRAEERRALAEQKRQEALQFLAEQREEKRRQRDASDMIGANEDAEKAVTDRGFEKFKSDLGQTDASPEELRKVYESQYHDKTVGGFAGADRYDIRESEKAKERLTQLQRRGASSGLITSAYNEQRDTRNAERAAEQDAFKQRQQASKEEIERARLDQKEADSKRDFSAMMARIERSGSGGGGGGNDEKARTSLDMERAIKLTVDSLARELRVPPTEVNTALGNLERKAARGDANATALLEKIKPRLDSLENQTERLRAYSSNEPVRRDEKPAPAPSDVKQNGGQSTKPKVDPVQALSQARQVLQQNPGARDEVLRRLKAAGIDPKGL